MAKKPKKVASNSEKTNGVEIASAPSSVASAHSDKSLDSAKASGSKTNGVKNGRSEGNEAQAPSLKISRNKHWRYISAFHGPWLQLPIEILETLAHSNFLSPRPRQTDPSVLYDLLKIRRLVDEASDLAVRAQNGTASSALNSDNAFPGASFGINCRGNGANAKLSPERKYRMRELATQKLSQAYRLDEIAASVATMQSASTLDAVASLVLQRAPTNADAKYVHFFHEKIPSRMMAECTPLDPLNDVIAYEPAHAAPFRTRAITRIFKDDHLGAIQDLTEALALCRHDQAKHVGDRNQLVLMQAARDEAEKRRTWSRDWMQENKVADDDQPKGLEMQLLFHRGNQYLTLASQYIRKALEQFRRAQRLRNSADMVEPQGGTEAQTENSSAGIEAYQRALDAREMIRKYAKRALRDYTAFCSHLDYAHAPAHMAHDSFFKRDLIADDVDEASSQALIQSQRQEYTRPDANVPALDGTKLPSVHEISLLLSAAPPADLPPFPPPISTALEKADSRSRPAASNPQHHEMVTYHPLMPETVHSLLLTHCLLQTPPTTLNRLANNAARVVRLAEGYPFFLSARSPARADWAEILRSSDNWIGLTGTWDSLCKAPLSQMDGEGQSHSRPSANSKPDQNALVQKQTANKTETSAQRKERIHKEAVMEALGDERVVDDESFQRAVEVREKRAWREVDADYQKHWGTTPDAIAEAAAHTNGHSPPSPAEPIGRGWSSKVAKDEEYLIGTERADAVARWVLDAPSSVETLPGKAKKSKKRPPKEKRPDVMGNAEHADHVAAIAV